MSDQRETLYNKVRAKDISFDKEISKTNFTTSKKVKILIFIITLFLCSIFFIVHLSDETSSTHLFSAKSGDKWTKQTITSQFAFPIYKDNSKYQQEVSDAKDNSYLVFLPYPAASENAIKFLDTLEILATTSQDKAEAIVADIFSPSTAKKIIQKKPEDRAKFFRTISKDLYKFYKYIYREFIVDTTVIPIKQDVIIVSVSPTEEQLVPKRLLVTSKVFISKARRDILIELNEDQRLAALELIAKNFKPNIIYSAKLTDEARIFAVKSVARTDGFVRAGEVIISKGEVVDEETTKKIKSYNLFKFKAGQNTYNFWLILGNIFHAAVIYSILILYLFIIRKRIFEDNVQIIILSASIVIVAFLAWLSIEVKSTLPIEYFVILPGVSMLVAIVFDSRTAFYLTVTMSLMLAGIRGNDYDTGTAMMFTGILASYSVRDIQSRTQMFKSISYIFIGFLASIIAFSLERALDWDLTIQKLLVALLNSAISPLATFGFLVVLEKFTNITTDLKLEEYDKVNHPLLVKLSEIAPGSYQHTLSMSVMAEKCATAINASQILAKVGALYHDIGKITKPEYFVENQIEIGNKHDMLTPKRSADAIKSHVIEGMKLAKEYKLPQRIIDFIPMHHGTFLIKHFYAKAVEEFGESAVHEEDYRYSGPKPNSKETAIVMICDSAEAISRVIGKSREDIEKMLNTTIQSRFTDGQFDECDLTLNDLHIIKEACVKHLYGSAHQRINYKEIQEPAPPLSDE